MPEVQIMALLHLLRSNAMRGNQIAAPHAIESQYEYFSSFPRWYVVGRRDGAIRGFAVGFLFSIAFILVMLTVMH
jgi:hypothetical protein